MFDNIAEKKTAGMKFRLLAIGSGIIHVAIGGALIIAGMWQIEEISRPNRGVVMAATLPGMASSGGSPKAAEPKALVKPKKKIVREERQPTDRKPEKTDPSTETNSQTGDSNGSGGNGEGEGPGEGSGSGDNPGPGNGEGGLGIIICLENCDVPSVPKAVVEDPPKHLPPTVLSQLTRVSGEAQVQPPSSTKNKMHLSKSKRIVALVQMCLNKQGAVNRQHIVKSSGHPEYDAKLLSAVRRWRYKPYRANGQAISICTHVTFVYQQ